MKTEPFKRLWVLVDKRGTILEHSQLRKASLKHGDEVPGFSFWKNRSSAQWQIRDIRKSMTPEAWKTWQFRPVQYKRATE
jgi:hypothetical protein